MILIFEHSSEPVSNCGIDLEIRIAIINRANMLEVYKKFLIMIGISFFLFFIIYWL